MSVDKNLYDNDGKDLGFATIASAENYASDFSAESWEGFLDSWGVDSSGIEEDILAEQDLFETRKETVSNSFSEFGDTTYQNWENTFGDATWAKAGANAVGVLDASAAFAMEYVRKKLDRIRQQLTTPVEVSLGTIMQDIAPKALSFTDASYELSRNIKPLVNMLTGLGSESWEEFGQDMLEDLLGELAEDPGIAEALGETYSMQAISLTLTTISDLMTTLETVIDFLEPIMPVIEITVDFAIAMVSCGTSTINAVDKQAQLTEKYIFDLLALFADTIRKYMYKLTFKVPQFVMLAIDTTLDYFGADDDYEWADIDWRVSAMLDESYSTGLKNKNKWNKVARKTLRDIKKTANQMSKGDLSGISDSFPQLKTNKAFNNASITAQFLGNASQEARKNIEINNIFEEYIVKALPSDREIIAGTDEVIDMDEADKAVRALLKNNGIKVEDIRPTTIKHLSNRLIASK